MLDELKKQLTSVHILIMLLIIAVGTYLFQTFWQVLANFADVFVILIISWLVSFLLEPAVDKITHFLRAPRLLSATIVFILFLGFLCATIFLFIPAVTTQFEGLSNTLPKYFANFPGIINKFGDFINTFLNNSITIIPSVANVLFAIFLILIISFYFIIDKSYIQKELFNIIPNKWHKEARFIQETIDTTFASFLRVQLFFGFIAGIATWIVLTLFQVNFAASTALLAGVLTTVPLLGAVLGIIPPVFVSFVTDPFKALFIFIILLLFQQVLFNIIGPKLMGKAFKMHPVIVLLSFLVGLKLAGGIGAILSVPILSIVIVVIHRLSQHFINPKEK